MSTQSMTGFAHLRRELADNKIGMGAPAVVLEWEAQSVNSRYLDIAWRADESLRFMELPIRHALKQRIERGRISINLSVQVHDAPPSTHPSSTINPPPHLADSAASANSTVSTHPTPSSPTSPLHPPLSQDSPQWAQAQQSMAQLSAWQSAVLSQNPQARPLSVFEWLSLMGLSAPMLAPDRTGSGWASLQQRLGLSAEAWRTWQEAAVPALLAFAQEGIVALCTSREQEAAKILPLLRDKAQAFSAHCTAIGVQAQNASRHFSAQLIAQINPLLSQVPSIEPARLAQEVALLAIRHDISEELERLGAHQESLHRLLQGDAPSLGKPLEFLLQELGREVNTIASKTTQTQVSQATLAMKHIIDQLREQAQNVQ